MTPEDRERLIEGLHEVLDNESLAGFEHDKVLACIETLRGLRWAILPTVQTIVHQCGKGITREQVSITGHPVRPEHAASIRKDWERPVMESRATCGCVRFRGVHDFQIGPDLKMHVLINAKDRSL